MSGSYTFLEHTADVGIEIRARSRAELFGTAALALMDWIGPRPATAATVRQNVALTAQDIEQLLVRWLQELVFQFQYRYVYTANAGVSRISDKSLQAVIEGIVWNEFSRQEYREVKAVTYHKLSVRREGRVWRAVVILDV